MKIFTGNCEISQLVNLYNTLINGLIIIIYRYLISDVLVIARFFCYETRAGNTFYVINQY